MLGLLKYWARYIEFKLSFEGEDVDSSYQGKFVCHNGRGLEPFDFYHPPEGFGIIHNIRQSTHQKKLQELRNEELKQLKTQAKQEMQNKREQRKTKKAAQSVKNSGWRFLKKKQIEPA